MQARALFAALAAACVLSACGNGDELRCEATARYATARSSPPVQIPDDLTPPDESQALRLPPASPGEVRAPTEPCLESPPSFFEQGRQFSTGTSDERDDRRSRRRERRAEAAAEAAGEAGGQSSGQADAPPPSSPAPSEPAPADSGDREITN